MKKSIFKLLLLITFMPVFSQTQFRVNDHATQRWQSTAVNATGDGFAIIWMDDRLNRTEHVFAQRFDAEGNPVGQNFLFMEEVDYPKIISDMQGDYLVYWEESWDLYVQRFDSELIAKGDPILINERVPSPSCIAADSSGEYYAVSYDAFEDSLVMQRFAANDERIAREILLNDVDSDVYGIPDIASSNEGSVLVCWLDERNGVGRDVYAQIVNSTGELVGGNIRISNEYPGSSWMASVAYNGNFIIVWKNNTTGNLYGQVIDEEGILIGTNFLITEDNPYDSEVASTSDSKVIVGWNDYPGIGRAIMIDSIGNLSGNPIRTTEERNLGQVWNTEVNITNDNKYLFSWYNLVEITNTDHEGDIYLNILDSFEDFQGADIQVNDNIENVNANAPAISIPQKGYDWGMAWHENRDSVQHIYYQWEDRFEDLRVSGLETDNGYAIQRNLSPDIAINRDYRMIVWEAEAYANYSEIYGQLVSNWINGDTVGSIFRISEKFETDNIHRNPSISANEALFIVTWEDERSGNPDIYAQLYDNSGVAIGGNFIVNDDFGSNDQYNPDVAMDNLGYSMVTWTDNREGSWEVYAQRINPDGSLYGDNFRVNEDRTKVYSPIPRIDRNSEGYTVVVWEETDANYIERVYCQKYSPSGLIMDSNIVVSDNFSDVSFGSTVAIDDNQNYIVSWVDRRNGNYDIYAQRVSEYNTKIDTANILITSISAGDQLWPDVTFLNNTVYTCWTSDHESPNRDIWASEADFNSLASGSIRLLSPTGAYYWRAGNDLTIRWESDYVSHVRIEYSIDNGITWSTIASSTTPEGTYSWTTPLVDSDECFIRVTDTGNEELFAQNTTPFSLYLPTISLTSPNGGEIWVAGSTHEITWISENLNEVSIEFSNDYGTNWTPVVDNTESDGSYIWNVPNIMSSECMIRITDISYGVAHDTVDGVFSIIPPETSHFVPAWSGNGFDQMNIYVYSSTIDGVDMQPGDEIGVFDAGTCVGAGLVTEIIGGEVILNIVASRDDPDTPEIDGYVTGNPVLYRAWDADQEKEIVNCEEVYLSGTGSYSVSGSAAVDLTFSSSVEQIVGMSEGWNIVSFAVTPGNPDMQALLLPLTEANVLVKVQDEAGNAMEELPAPIGWINNIGNIACTEGYKIKVSKDTSLTVSGTSCDLPLIIPLSANWNIMGYPSFASQSALDVFDPLITGETLLKVQDEAGNAIEELPAPIYWVDNIGTLTQGKGYKVKVSADTEISIAESITKSALNDMRTGVKAAYFTPVWPGNGLDHMNIYVLNPTYLGIPLLPGDEIGVFEKDLCVGVGVVSSENPDLVSIVASVDDPLTKSIDGFTGEGAISIKYWSPNRNTVGVTGTYHEVDGYTLSLKKNGTSVIQVDFNKEKADFLGDAYPNPASNMTQLTFGNSERGDITLDVVNSMGQVVNILVQGEMEEGIHHIQWTLNNSSDARLSEGTYFYRLKTNNSIITKSLIILN